MASVPDHPTWDDCFHDLLGDPHDAGGDASCPSALNPTGFTEDLTYGAALKWSYRQVPEPTSGHQRAHTRWCSVPAQPRRSGRGRQRYAARDPSGSPMVERCRAPGLCVSPLRIYAGANPTLEVAPVRKRRLERSPSQLSALRGPAKANRRSWSPGERQLELHPRRHLRNPHARAGPSDYAKAGEVH